MVRVFEPCFRLTAPYQPESPTMSKPKRLKARAAAAIPQTREAVTAAIRDIGTAQRQLARIDAGMNDALAKVRETFETQADPLRKQITELQAGVQTWCEANRTDLTQNNKVKTAAFPSGEVQWRMRPPSVAVRSVEAVLDTLKRLGLERFTRVKVEVNKEAILADPEGVKGVAGITINRGEDFVVAPFETELAEV